MPYGPPFRLPRGAQALSASAVPEDTTTVCINTSCAIYAISRSACYRFYSDEEEPKVEFDQICAVLQLAHKYHVEDVERQALSALKAHYTNDFDTYDDRDEDDP